MARNGESTAELKDGHVPSQPAAERVGEAMRLLPHVLLRDVERVRFAFIEWWNRMEREEAALQAEPATHETPVARVLVQDFIQL